MTHMSEIVFLTEEHGKLATLNIAASNEKKAGSSLLLEITEAEAVESGEERVQLVESTVYEYSLIIHKPIKSQEISIQTTGSLDGIIKPRKDNPLLGTIETGLQVGLLPLVLMVNSRPTASVGLEVRSSKADYRTDYQRMIEKIASYSTSLVLNIRAPSQARVLADVNSNALIDFQTQFAFLNSLIGSRSFHDAIERIVSLPATYLEDEFYQVNIGRNIKPSRGFMSQFAKGSPRVTITDPTHALYARLSGDPPKSLPARVNITRKRDITDTPENRFVKHTLRTFSSVLADLGVKLRKLIDTQSQSVLSSAQDNRLVREIDGLRSKIEEMLNRPFFDDISDPDQLSMNSPALQRKPGYREVLQAWLNFELALSVVWKGGEDIFGAGKKDVARLYEYWLFIVFLEMLPLRGKFYSAVAEELLEHTADGLGLKLKSGNSLMIHGYYEINNKRFNLTLLYNYTFALPGSWSRIFRPDITLCFYPVSLDFDAARRLHRIAYLHFDAKYKVQYRPYNLAVDLEEEKRTETSETYKRDDLLKMHAYKDAIKGSQGAYVLYPGKAAESVLFCENEGKIIPGIGAFSIRPSEETETDHLIRFLDQVVEHLIFDVQN